MKVENHFFTRKKTPGEILKSIHFNDGKDFVFIYDMKNGRYFKRGSEDKIKVVRMGEISCLVALLNYPTISNDTFDKLMEFNREFVDEKKQNFIAKILLKYLHSKGTYEDHENIIKYLYIYVEKIRKIDVISRLKNFADNIAEYIYDDEHRNFVYVIRNVYSEYRFHQAVSEIHSIKDVNILEKLLSTINSK